MTTIVIGLLAATSGFLLGFLVGAAVFGREIHRLNGEVAFFRKRANNPIQRTTHGLN